MNRQLATLAWEAEYHRKMAAESVAMELVMDEPIGEILPLLQCFAKGGYDDGG